MFVDAKQCVRTALAVLLTSVLLLPWHGVSAASENVRGGMGATSGNADITGNARSLGQDRKRSTQINRSIRPGVRTLNPREVMCTYAPPAASIGLPVAGLAVRTACAAPVLARTGVPAPPPPEVQAETAARDYVRTLSMPVPQPKMSAPAGVCGARHWVDLGVPGATTFAPEETAFGPLRATARGQFVVDWGDGTVETVEATSGSNSRIFHSWATVGAYDVTVRAQWSLEWRLGGFSGVIDGLSTDGVVTDWPVIEAQAVLVR